MPDPDDEQLDGRDDRGGDEREGEEERERVCRQWLGTRRPLGIRVLRDGGVVVLHNGRRLRLAVAGFELGDRDELVLDVSADVRPLPSHRFPREHR